MSSPSFSDSPTSRSPRCTILTLPAFHTIDSTTHALSFILYLLVLSSICMFRRTLILSFSAHTLIFVSSIIASTRIGILFCLLSIIQYNTVEQRVVIGVSTEVEME
jgi:hypothetical protein